MKSEAIIALGANIPLHGQPPAMTIMAAMKSVSDIGPVMACSSLWQSPAWPDPTDPPYINAAIRLRTSLSPQDTLSRLQDIEHRFGRRRSVANAPRTLDLDLVDYAGQCLEEEGLSLPHPRAHQRAFVLVPVREIAPHWCHPASGIPIDVLANDLPVDDLRSLCRVAQD